MPPWGCNSPWPKLPGTSSRGAPLAASGSKWEKLTTRAGRTRPIVATDAGRRDTATARRQRNEQFQTWWSLVVQVQVRRAAHPRIYKVKQSEYCNRCRADTTRRIGKRV